MNRFFALLLAAMLLSGCTSSGYTVIDVPPPQRAVDSLAVGDTARIQMTDGREIITDIVAIESDVVVGESEQIPVEDIAGIAVLQEYDQTADVARVVWVYALLGYLVSLAF